MLSELLIMALPGSYPGLLVSKLLIVAPCLHGLLLSRLLIMALPGATRDITVINVINVDNLSRNVTALMSELLDMPAQEPRREALMSELLIMAISKTSTLMSKLLTMASRPAWEEELFRTVINVDVRDRKDGVDNIDSFALFCQK